jgi:phage terminase small subunit
VAKLTPKQQRFLAEYLRDANATQAAVRAGYSARTAHVQGWRLLKNVEVARALKEAQGARAHRLQLDADEFLGELRRIALSDPAKAFDAHGQPLPIDQVPEELRRAISGCEVEELAVGSGKDEAVSRRVRKYKFWDKVKAVELGLKHLGLLKDKVEHEVGPGLAELIAASRKADEP